MAPQRRRKLTTHQIARMLDVSGQSVSNWIDAGQLPAERTPGGHRRVEPDDLLAFLRRKQMRVPPELDDGPPLVLVVDDEPDVALLYARAVQTGCPDCQVVTAHDGFDAGRIATSQRPDVVILDLYMPGMDGFEVCRRLKQNPQTQQAKVIAVTAHPSEQAEQAIRAAGAEEYLPKPVSPERLARCVRELVGLTT